MVSFGPAFTLPPSCAPWLHGVTPFHRYYGRSDFCPSLSLGQISLLHVHDLPTIPPPTTPQPPPSLSHATPQLGGLPGFSTGLGFATSEQARRAAQPNRVRHPTDWSFTSCCSPPRLSATQLQSITGRRAHASSGLSPLRSCTLAGALTPAKAGVQRRGKRLGSHVFPQAFSSGGRCTT